MTNETQAPAIKCGHCGNDGSRSGLYLSIDAAWKPDLGAWELQERDDSGGVNLDCLECDGQTECNRAALFPYGVKLKPPGAAMAGAAAMLHQPVSLNCSDPACPILITAYATPEYVQVLMPMRMDGPVITPDYIAKLNRSPVDAFVQDAPACVARLAAIEADSDLTATAKRYARRDASRDLARLVQGAIAHKVAGGQPRRDARLAVLVKLADMRGDASAFDRLVAIATHKPASNYLAWERRVQDPAQPRGQDLAHIHCGGDEPAPVAPPGAMIIGVVQEDGILPSLNWRHVSGKAVNDDVSYGGYAVFEDDDGAHWLHHHLIRSDAAACSDGITKAMQSELAWRKRAQLLFDLSVTFDPAGPDYRYWRDLASEWVSRADEIAFSYGWMARPAAAPRLVEGDQHYGVHMAHCGALNDGGCAYGEDAICPALDPSPAAAGWPDAPLPEPEMVQFSPPCQHLAPRGGGYRATLIVLAGEVTLLEKQVTEDAFLDRGAIQNYLGRVVNVMGTLITALQVEATIAKGDGA